LDEPLAHLGILPGGINVFRELVPVVFEKLLELVTFGVGCFSIRDQVVLNKVSTSLSIGPCVPDSVVGSVPVILHGSEEAAENCDTSEPVQKQLKRTTKDANSLITLGLSRSLDISLLLEPVSDSVVIPGLISAVAEGVVIILSKLDKPVVMIEKVRSLR
jgi:hypothetical protein